MVSLRNSLGTEATEKENFRSGTLPAPVLSFDGALEAASQNPGWPVKRRGREGAEFGSTPAGTESASSAAFLYSPDGPANDVALRDGGLWIAEVLAQNGDSASDHSFTEWPKPPRDFKADDPLVPAMRSIGFGMTEPSIGHVDGTISAVNPDLRDGVASSVQTSDVFAAGAASSAKAADAEAHTDSDRGTSRGQAQEHSDFMEVDADERDEDADQGPFHLNGAQEEGVILIVLNAVESVLSDVSNAVDSLLFGDVGGDADVDADHIHFGALLGRAEAMVFVFPNAPESAGIGAFDRADAAGFSDNFFTSPTLNHAQQDLATLLINHQLTWV